MLLRVDFSQENLSCSMVKYVYGLSVMNETSFFRCISVTDHLLLAMPHLSIETKMPHNVLFKGWNVPFFYSRKINQRRIQISLRQCFMLV